MHFARNYTAVARANISYIYAGQYLEINVLCSFIFAFFL